MAHAYYGNGNIAIVHIFTSNRFQAFKVTISFLFQSYRDNPKVNAIIVIKGAINGKNFGLQKYILSETRITRENNLTHCQLVSLFGGCFHEKMHFLQVNEQ